MKGNEGRILDKYEEHSRARARVWEYEANFMFSVVKEKNAKSKWKEMK